MKKLITLVFAIFVAISATAQISFDKDSTVFLNGSFKKGMTFDGNYNFTNSTTSFADTVFIWKLRDVKRLLWIGT